MNQTNAPTPPEETPEPGKQRERSPSYPAIGLQTAVELAGKFWEHDKRQSVLVTRAGVNLGFTAKSSKALLAIAAMKKYGFLEEEGTGETRKVKLTESGIRIVNPSDPNRAQLLREAALKPPIHAFLWETFCKDGASDGTIRDHLVFEKKFTEDAADSLIPQFKDTITFAKLRDSDKVAATDEQNKPESQEPAQPVTAPPPPQGVTPLATDKAILRPHANVMTREFSFPLDDANEVELKFFGTTFGFEQLEALSDVITFLKTRFKRKMPQPPAQPEIELDH